MKFKVKNLNIKSGGPLITVIDKHDASLMDLKPIDRIRIKHGKKSVIAVMDISEEHGNIKDGQIGMFQEVCERLNVKNNKIVDVEFVGRPKSIDCIRKKLDGKELSLNEIDIIIKDLIENRLTETELTYFVSGAYTHGLSDKETYYLTKAIVDNGKRLGIKRKIILDKHSIGGISGNRTTMIIVPIIAAAGFTIPKTSSRAISSASGTADVMECLARVDLSIEELRKVVKKTNACMAWAGTIDLASADDTLIKIRNPLRLDPEGMLLASIMAKKVAVGSSHVLIDIPIGREAKVKNVNEAKRLKSKFEKLGKMFKIKVKVIITNGSQPIGNGVGPNLEARDVLYVLTRNEKAPKDLDQKAILMAETLLRMVNVKDADKLVKFILNSGLAYNKMKEIIKAQGGNSNIKINDLKVGRFKHDVKAGKNGIVKDVDNDLINKIARIAGAPIDKDAGIYLNKHEGEKVKRKEILFTIYARNKERLKDAMLMLNKNIVKIR